MNLYLDDDTTDRRLISFLRKAGHAVVLPADVGLAGASDARHLIHALRNDLVFLTRNHDDFLDLHELVQVAHGSHPGILIVRFDNDPTRDMTPRGIAAAITKLESSGLLLSNNLHVLNHWR